MEALLAFFPLVLALGFVFELGKRSLVSVSLKHGACYYARLRLLHTSEAVALDRTRQELKRLAGAFGEKIFQGAKWEYLPGAREVQATTHLRFSSGLKFQDWAAHSSWTKHHFEVTEQCSLPRSS